MQNNKSSYEVQQDYKLQSSLLALEHGARERGFFFWGGGGGGGGEGGAGKDVYISSLYIYIYIERERERERETEIWSGEGKEQIGCAPPAVQSYGFLA